MSKPQKPSSFGKDKHGKFDPQATGVALDVIDPRMPPGQPGGGQIIFPERQSESPPPPVEW